MLTLARDLMVSAKGFSSFADVIGAARSVEQG
jgi:hypothetical protein